MMSTKKIIIEGTFPEQAGEDAKFRVTVEPELTEQSTRQDFDTYLSLAISGISKTLSTLLSNYEVLRAPTNTEIDNHFYYFLDEKTLTMFKSRKKLYQELSEVFNTVLRVNFPDVEYINKCDEHLQNYVFNKSEAKVDKYKKKLEVLVEQVKKELEDTKDVPMD